MQLDFSSHFKKEFGRAPQKIQKKVIERLSLLLTDEFHPLLNNHKLAGEFSSYRSINITGDWRAIYQKTDEGVYRLFHLGTHSELYS